jgi:hypothetical protein
MRSFTVGVNTAGQEVVDRQLAAPHDRGLKAVGDRGPRMLRNGLAGTVWSVAGGAVVEAPDLSARGAVAAHCSMPAAGVRWTFPGMRRNRVNAKRAPWPGSLPAQGALNA